MKSFTLGIARLAPVLLFILVFFSGQNALAQGEKQVITFSGLIVDGDSAYGVPGVHVYVPRAGRGTATDRYGAFTMPTLAGDTVVISAVGYKKHRLIIPRDKLEGYSVLIDLQSDTTFLPMVEVFPFPSIEVFKEVFLASHVADSPEQMARKNLSQEKIREMSMALPMSSEMNYRMFTNQHYSAIANRNSSTTISLLNPFAWAEFIRSVKRGDFKKKK